MTKEVLKGAIMIKITNRLKEVREELGLSIKEASAKIGVTPKTLKKWENEFTNINLRYLRGIHKAYGAKINYLFFYEDKKRR